VSFWLEVLHSPLRVFNRCPRLPFPFSDIARILSSNLHQNYGLSLDRATSISRLEHGLAIRGLL
ncbi:hypothetical protein Droror1_Dr00002392, partial [Drosera rotundifolia]